MLSVRNIDGNNFGMREDDSLISEEDYFDLCRAFEPEPGDVLLAIVGATLGKAAIVPVGLGRFHIQRSVAIFRPRAHLSSRWLHYCFLAGGFQRLLWEYTGFSAQPGIYLGTLANFKVPCPSGKEQSAIVAFLDEELAKLDQLRLQAEHAITLLKERRSTLIAAAVTGKIDVRQVA